MKRKQARASALRKKVEKTLEGTGKRMCQNRRILFFSACCKNRNPNLSPEDYAVVTMPKRRHKVRNFATLIFISIAEQLGLPFFEDCAFAPSKHRVGTVFTANNIPPLRNIIVFDDFVTTGQTLVSMQNLLVSLGKNCVFFTGINNKL